MHAQNVLICFLFCIYLLICTCEGDLVDAVVPFMGESISDGTLATFLKSMLALHPTTLTLFS